MIVRPKEAITAIRFNFLIKESKIPYLNAICIGIRCTQCTLSDPNIICSFINDIFEVSGDVDIN